MYGKKKICELCGKTDNDVEMFVGGFVTYAHPKCIRIAIKALKLHEKWLYEHKAYMDKAKEL